ncbi:helix-turn-helix domain-containing protein [Nannocystis sp. ILAH1]|uniref:helix-turn-helix transcriptional regulator n=1 Tax=unclassified Nannocystis TaxID=2627009 RepID=UPI002270CFD1|nr:MULTISPECIES: helix-turn-helix domain-containing protein [unclassified Nannocystis]MCY0987426.1 helix-turn-helix domain-containing protein [Nannocystis sp. ILAH1]MCY1070778.1 helix-turn-helix domain-containing protein [Nannocystis sp. RBIL2]
MRKVRASGPPKLETESPLLTADDLAVWFHCSRRAVYDRVFRNQIPGVVRLGRRLYFDRVTIQEWLKRRLLGARPDDLEIH